MEAGFKSGDTCAAMQQHEMVGPSPGCLGTITVTVTWFRPEPLQRSENYMHGDDCCLQVASALLPAGSIASALLPAGCIASALLPAGSIACCSILIADPAAAAAAAAAAHHAAQGRA
jgi:hypothetical protein